jgi:hypothetical protein
MNHLYKSLGICISLLWISTAAAQLAATEFAAPPTGFDVRSEEVARGKVELVEYESSTVGSKRKANL